MDLTQLNIPANKITQLKNAGLESLEDIVYTFPKKYIDRTTFTGILPEGESVFLFNCESVHLHNTSKMLITEARGTLAGTTAPVSINWFQQPYQHDDIRNTKGKQILVAGVAKVAPAEYGKPARYVVSSPAVYQEFTADALRIWPEYKRVPGMAKEYYEQKVLAVARRLVGDLPETLPEQIIQNNNLISHQEMVNTLHDPSNAEALEQALARKRWDDLVYFALRLEIDNRSVPNGSIFGLPSLAAMNKVRDGLPFHLTHAQNDALENAIEHIRSGKRLNALLQGDVGSGKTIVAQLLMIAFAANGWQAAMMAPTQILAKQHYEGLTALCEDLHIPVYFVGTGIGAKNARLIAEKAASGETALFVGTQALLSEKYHFKNLALVVEDEEHKYGVLQKKALTERASGGTHILTMSATPIPLTLAQTVYGDSLQLYSVNEKPAGRKPVLTGVANTEAKAIAFLRHNCGKHHKQAYIVCPMIAANEKAEGVASAEETFAKYEAALKPDGISVALITGKTKKTDAQQIISDFEKGLISVLVATTIIEVGVNVPNANCIIIHNAERFGLAQLHQLRGRVGRNSEQAYCSLISQDIGNPRLEAMVKHNDGFMIAQLDLSQRGPGDFLGVQQSGTEKYLAQALQYPSEYKRAQAAAREILDKGADCTILEQAVADREAQKGGELI